MSRAIIYFHVLVISDVPITECACLHKTVNMVVYLLKVMKISTQKGEHPCKCTELSLKWK